MFYIPTYKECLEFVNENPQMYFYERKYIIDDYHVSIFGYRHASYNNFMLPVINKPQINALELKGISYIFDDNGKVYKHNLMLHKFWELDQYDFCKYDYFKDKKIKNVTTKEDGFLITFIELPSGDIISQTKKGFDGPENLKANEYLNKNNYKIFIQYCIMKNYQPIFELVNNNFYVKYDNEKLILTKIRDNKTGKYIDIDELRQKVELPIIETVSKLDYTLDELMEMRKYETNIEGWIVHFEDDNIIKIKTEWWKEQKSSK